MGLEEVVEEILNNAKQKADKIKTNAKKESRNILSNTEREIKALRQKWAAENRKLEEEIRRKRLAAAKLEASKLIMNTKKEIIEDVMKGLIERLKNLERRDKDKLVSSLARIAKSEIEVATVYCNKDELELIEKHFKGVRIKPIECEGGFIAENEDGTVSVDMRYATLLEKVKKDIIREIGSKLFKDM